LGFLICAMVRGIHVATKRDYALIALPINAAVYALVVFGLLRLVSRKARA